MAWLHEVPAPDPTDPLKAARELAWQPFEGTRAAPGGAKLEKTWMEVQLEAHRAASPPVCDGEVPNALVVEMTRRNGEGREKEGVASSANVVAGSTDDVRRVLNTARMLLVINLLERVGAVVLDKGEALDPNTTTSRCEHCKLTVVPGCESGCVTELTTRNTQQSSSARRASGGWRWNRRHEGSTSTRK